MGIFTSFVMSLPSNSDNELSFDTAQFDAVISNAEAASASLAAKRDKLVSDLAELRSNWRTPAGEYFFSMIDDQWVDDVQKYINTLNVFITVMQNANNVYSYLEEDANNLVFKG